MKTFWKIFIGVIALAVLVAGILIIMYFTNNFTTDFSTFYVRQGATEYRQDSTVNLQSGVYYTFDCKYTLGFPKSEKGDRYSVTVAPNENLKGISYRVDDETVTIPQSLDFSSAFEITKELNSFYFKIPEGISFSSALSAAYKGQSVSNIPSMDLSGKPCFDLVIKSYNGKSVIRLGIIINGV